MIIPFEAPLKEKEKAAKQLSIIYDIVSDCKERKQKAVKMGFSCSAWAFREIINTLQDKEYNVEIGKSLAADPNHHVITIKGI